MNVIYVYKISEFQAKGNQIDISKKIAKDFFNISEEDIKNGNNISVNVCHISNLTNFDTIEIQPAGNIRWSTSLNTYLAKKEGTPIQGGDLLVVEKIGRSFCVWTLKNGDSKYDVLLSLFDEKETSLLLTVVMKEIDFTKIPTSYTEYISAIRTKPFILLAGISGTGKSRIVRQLARACDNLDDNPWTMQKPMNFEMIQVKPNWHDSSELLGYVSRIDGEKFVAGDFLKFIVKAWENPGTPFFLCLDEMNLAPVEQYFAEYLSVIESRRLNEYGEVVTDPIVRRDDAPWYSILVKNLTKDQDLRDKFEKEGISIPQNLVVMGTVNMDETTFSFSRKVLDRAMTIEMNEVDLKGGLTEDDLKKEQFTIAAADILPKAVEGKDVYEGNKELCDKVIEYLGDVNNVLEGTPFKIAYRTRNEFLIYAVNRGETNYAKAMDEMTSMKILSRIEGDDVKMLNADGNNVLDGLKTQVEKLGLAEESVSLKKIAEMKKRLASGYTSYWS